jgi:predicted permease
VWSVIDRMLFQPLPYADADRLVHIHNFRGSEGDVPSTSTIAVLTRELELAASFAGVGSVGGARSPTELSDGTTLRLDGASWNSLRLLGIRPVAGRDFVEADADPGLRQRAVLLREEVWERRYGRSPDVFDRMMPSRYGDYFVVGILPRGWLVPASSFGGVPDGVVVQPRMAEPTAFEMTASAIARLQPGVSLTEAQAEVDVIFRRVAAEHNSPLLERVPATVQALRAGLFGNYASRAWLLVAAVSAVLLVTCVNLAVLFLARGGSRIRDAAICSALGATRRRIVCAELLQAAAVCSVATVVALVVCVLSYEALLQLVPAPLRTVAASPLDLRLVGAAVVTALVIAGVAGVAPAFRAARVNVVDGLRTSPEAGRRRLRGGAALLALEAALGVVLVAGAAATVRSFVGVAFGDQGFEAADLVEANVQHGSKRSVRGYEPARVATALEVVRGLPGVIAAGPVNLMPVGSSRGNAAFWRDRGVSGTMIGAGDGLFAALRTPVLVGREFNERDVQTRAQVAVINRHGARVLFPEAELSTVPGRTVDIDKVTHVIVGVVEDIRSVPGDPALPSLVVPLTSTIAPASQSGIVVAVRMEPGRALDAVGLDRRLDEALGSNVLPTTVIADQLPAYLKQPRFQAFLFGSVAVIGLLLTAIGLYAVAAFEVARRRYELGVRASLGATAADIRRLVVRTALRPVLVGAAAGLVAAWWLGQFLQSFLVEVDARDPWTGVLVAGVLVTTAVVAVWRPARQAAAIDPAVTLRAL